MLFVNRTQSKIRRMVEVVCLNLLFTVPCFTPLPAVAAGYESELETLAKSGDAEAQFALALLYEFGGESIIRDTQQSVFWYEAAANGGLAGACLYLGLKYEHGNSVPRDYEKASCWYRCAAQQGWANAQLFLARLCKDGKGGTVSLVETLAWFGLAAEQGYPGAMEEYRALQQQSGFTNGAELQAKQEGLLHEERTPCN